MTVEHMFYAGVPDAAKLEEDEEEEDEEGEEEAKKAKVNNGEYTEDEIHAFKSSFSHLDMADLLCPLSMRDEFERDPVAFTSKVIDSNIVITDDDFLTFMYESGTEYDPDDLLTGFLKSCLLLRVFRHIFTGPSTGLYATNSPNKSKVKKFDLTKVTGEMIAYTCVQTYLTLSSAAKWKHFIDLFNLNDFYNSIIGLINENTNMQWGKELLEWWAISLGFALPSRRRRPSQAELMQAQLHEREQQLAQKEHELEEREQWLKQPTSQCHMPTPPQNPCQSTPHHSHENSERRLTKQLHHMFEDDEDADSEQSGDEGRPEGEDEIEDGGWSEGEGEMEDEENSPHAIQKNVRVQKVIKRRADDEMEVNDGAEELIGKYRHESKKFEIEKAKALEHLKALRAQAKEGGCAEKDNRSNEVELQSVKKKKEVISAVLETP
ncbi:hypothetical protein CPB84DRAFT_1842665 [Gymnopilus junonius]|uniref:Uncharacterized protein n=1 Tax=Gymnopilus junonius TaxID=109634 RepID=A0A9P5NX97_GYMJU|nr:hypothetical protein CPB84DRAFT_1842665 [Gymnopilus junonius]